MVQYYTAIFFAFSLFIFSLFSFQSKKLTKHRYKVLYLLVFYKIDPFFQELHRALPWLMNIGISDLFPFLSEMCKKYGQFVIIYLTQYAKWHKKIVFKSFLKIVMFSISSIVKFQVQWSTISQTFAQKKIKVKLYIWWVGIMEGFFQIVKFGFSKPNFRKQNIIHIVFSIEKRKKLLEHTQKKIE